jgi:penicillin-binding protein 2
MLVVDQLKKDDFQLRVLATVVFGGMLVLFMGLWWVQLIASKHFRDQLEIQSVRTVRLPAVRGKILDREGRALAESRPSYNVDLYLEELSTNFQAAYSVALKAATSNLTQQAAARQKQLGRKLTREEKKQFAVSVALRDQLQRQTRYEVVSNLVAGLSARLQEPINLSEKEFQAKYDKARALPISILPISMNASQIARFEEQSAAEPGMDLNIQSARYYPNGTVAAHLLGYLVHNAESGGNEQRSEYNYRLPDYIGVAGIEGIFDNELRGTAGEKSVLVNYLGYRQSENVWAQAEPGRNVHLTIDLDLQKAADQALQNPKQNARIGALVVMDVRNGDILAMSTLPAYDPNHFVEHPPQNIWTNELALWNDTEKEVQMNHAAQGEYAPGSIFKIVVGMAALEQGLDPGKIYMSPGYVTVPGRTRPMGDTAPAGPYDFERALAKSCNFYFYNIATNPGVLPKIIALGQRLHLGERTGLLPHQEDRGYFPDPKDIASRSWHTGNTANISIGQEKVAVTPLQIAAMVSAVANGGTLYWPRLVTRIDPASPDEAAQTFPAGRVRDTLGVSQRTLGIIHDAMLADVESPEGTGHSAGVPGLQIGGKTGTAEVEKNGHIEKAFKITWFASFAPVESPRYAVVVMVVSGASGGLTCAPIAHYVYEAIQAREIKRTATSAVLGETR